MRRQERLANLSQVALVLVIDDQLVGIGPSIGADGHGFAAINQLRATFAEALPASQDFFGNSAGRGPIPALHWLNRVAIADRLFVDERLRDGLGEWRSGTSNDCV